MLRKTSSLANPSSGKQLFYARYPEYETPETIFDFDDIGDNTFIIGCNINQKDSKYQMFLYKTQNYTIDEEVQ